VCPEEIAKSAGIGKTAKLLSNEPDAAEGGCAPQVSTNREPPNRVAFLLEKRTMKHDDADKREIMAAIVACTRKLGYVPSLNELLKNAPIRRRQVRRLFGSYAQALRACSLERGGPGHRISMEELFRDWGAVARALKKLPSLSEYEMHGKYSPGPLTKRFKAWVRVPEGMKRFAEDQEWKEEWADVLKIVAEQDRARRSREDRTSPTLATATWPQLPMKGPIYGPLLRSGALAHGPINEDGVIFAFGTVAERLGFVVTRVQSEFPDCEALRRIGEERWQRLRIEFEYESRNFLRHMHDPNECDLIICWEHNWPECPLEVLELRKVVSYQQPESSGA
jgi:Homing endonuclease associated repeat